MGENIKKIFWKVAGPLLRRALKEKHKDVSEISIQEVNRLVKRGESMVLLDVREKEELALGYLKDSVFIPRASLPEKAETLLPDKDAPLVVYCAAGVRSILAAKTLREMGYQHVSSMREGIEGWKKAGYEVASNTGLTTEQLTRYSRHILLQEVGAEGQAKLLKAKVLLVGAGGLGCPIGLYLAAAGVGTLGIIDDDRVDLTNLQRQILHRTSDVGRPKVESAKEAIARINPDVKVITYAERLTSENAIKIFENYDIIVDGSDNFPTKYLVNDAAFFTGKPFVFGGVFQFEGQASVFAPKEGGPCLRCLFPEPP
ncbi:MAG: molybdopterin biosynthesis protein MoeB, partial [Deltaproteobacteria bacterium]|nr:molybdopterin biosynthesis protein MoeB [Deltaproteobacteria bacterium]